MLNKTSSITFKVCFAFLVIFAPQVFAQVGGATSSTSINWVSDDGTYSLKPQLRIQFRGSSPFDSEPTSLEGFEQPSKNSLEINRARLKLTGHTYYSWLKYNIQYELASNRLIDFDVRIERSKELSLKLGQWKAEYSRERSISSGGQQMMDRSIINRVFTIDRQQGISLYGQVDAGGAANFNYWTGVFNGSGRGGSSNDDNHFMYSGRVEWNPFGKAVGFKSSDLTYSEEPVLSLGLAIADHQSRYTRFSSSGGGSLEGFNVGDAGQFKISQHTLDAALMYKGFSGQAEYHEKVIKDTFNNNAEVNYEGFYVQAGYFLHSIFEWWPDNLELATRYAEYETDLNNVNNVFDEASLALNLFLNKHKNKVTFQVSELSASINQNEQVDRTRYQIQWDFSF
ncbi:porin [Alteromonas facilis]|uniref:porin n=1 Tax=Alteromonas facilis TaxID=2048004 RepID=UPI000C293CFE|nr:porin [Alteromonas facilis]